MKKLFGALLALVSSVAFATTTVPVQLLNPTGSTSGQAIVSTGASSAPAWGGIGLNGIASIASNTVLANATASSAAPTAFAMPSCSTSASALNWTTSTGFTCNTSVNAAQLSGNAVGTSGAAVPLLNGTNTWSGAQTFTSTITPSQTAGIVGTTTNNNANAGSDGEYTSLPTTATSLSNGVSANCTSLSLTAGDWDVSGVIRFNAAATTVPTILLAGSNTVSATVGAFGTFTQISASFATASQNYLPIPVWRESLSATTTVFAVANASFTTSTMTCDGFLRARRIR